MKFIFFVFTLSMINAAVSTDVEICESDIGVLPDVTILGCSEQPCRLVKGKDAQLTIAFKSSVNTNTLVPRVVAKALGLVTVYPLPADRRDACKSLSKGGCPVSDGDDLEYNLSMPVLSIFPSVPVELEFSLLGDEGSVACFRVNAVVVST